MQFPKVAAAQRLQTLLLFTTLVAITLAAVLFSDLVRTFRTTVVADAQKSLSNAVHELIQAEGSAAGTKGMQEPTADADLNLQRISYEVLRSYPDIEGGYLLGTDVVGHTFPTYTEPGSELKQPAVERDAIIGALSESQRTHQVAHRVFEDQRDVVVATVLSLPDRRLAAWGLKRYLNFTESRHLRRQLFLVTLLVVALGSITGALSISFRMQWGFARIQAGLARLRTEPSYRLPGEHHDLQPIVSAINEMADSRQRLEGDLRREDRLRVMGRVVAGIAHEIRNPLNSIRLSVQMLARRLRGQPDADETAPRVLAEVDRLDGLLKSLLIFGADEPGRLRNQPLAPVLERTLALVRPQMRERGIDATVDLHPDMHAVVDGDHLQQALINLLLNAIDAAGAGGRIELKLQAPDGQVEIDVRDSGPGLDADQQEHLFEAFYTTKMTGTGLGLAVTRTLVEKMGGQVDYVPATEGGHFRIRLPRFAEETTRVCARES